MDRGKEINKIKRAGRTGRRKIIEGIEKGKGSFSFRCRAVARCGASQN
jgi:hypothetical protein